MAYQGSGSRQPGIYGDDHELRTVPNNSVCTP